MPVAGFAHVAVPTARRRELISFYHALSFEVPDPESLDRAQVPAFAIRFGSGKINVHLPVLGEQLEDRVPPASPRGTWSSGHDTVEEGPDALQRFG